MTSRGWCYTVTDLMLCVAAADVGDLYE